VTGGMGFIGSHTVIEIVKSGKHCIIVDTLENSS
jgi:UDP-glucose 4-epimerase